VINYYSVYLLFQARFLLSKVNPSQTHNNMYATAWGQQVGFTTYFLIYRCRSATRWSYGERNRCLWV